MSRLTLSLAGATAATAAVAAALLLPGQLAQTADHIDPPARTDPAVDPTPDRAADIADIYAWHEGDVVNLIVTFGGPAAVNLPAAYDRAVLHTINISTSAPASSADVTIRFRFGQGANPNDWGIRVDNIPGVGTIEGPVEQTLSRDGVRVRAGLFDDPFFFDSQGLRESRSTGTIRFNKDRSFFANANITAVIIQIPRSRFGNATDLDIWSTSGRLGGQLS